MSSCCLGPSCWVHDYFISDRKLYKWEKEKVHKSKENAQITRNKLHRWAMNSHKWGQGALALLTNHPLNLFLFLLFDQWDRHWQSRHCDFIRAKHQNPFPDPHSSFALIGAQEIGIKWISINKLSSLLVHSKACLGTRLVQQGPLCLGMP